MIEGDTTRGPSTYLLVGCFVASDVNDGVITGAGWCYRPGKPLTEIDAPWFKLLRSERANFSTGFGETKHPDVIAGLLQTEEQLLSDVLVDDLARLPPALSDDPEDQRVRALASVVRRQGQREFRDAVMSAYQGRCAITGWNVPEALEAAHVRRYLGLASNDPRNGLLLRADIHSLLDAGLLTIDPDAWVVRVSPALASSDAASLDGMALRLPSDPSLRPDAEAVRAHFQWTRARWTQDAVPR